MAILGHLMVQTPPGLGQEGEPHKHYTTAQEGPGQSWCCCVCAFCV